MQDHQAVRRTRDTGGAIAAIAGTICVIGSVVVGIQLMTAMSAGSLVDAGGDQRLGQHVQLLTAAEALKLASAVTAAWVAASLDRRFNIIAGKAQPIALAVGILSAVLLAASAVTGLAPLHFGIGDPEKITPLAHGLGLASVALNGVWAGWVVLSAWHNKVLPRWLCFVGGVLALVSLTVLALPPAGLLMAAAGVVWSTGLALTFLRK